MNSYFDQQWDQQLAGRPQALAAFSSLDSAAQEKIVGYIQSLLAAVGLGNKQLIDVYT